MHKNTVLFVAIGIFLKGLDKEGCDLWFQERKPGLWEFPGGKIEGSETSELACQREINEEVGIPLSDLAKIIPFKAFQHTYPDVTIRLFTHLLPAVAAIDEIGSWQRVNFVDKAASLKVKTLEANIELLNDLCDYLKVRANREYVWDLLTNS